MASLPWIGLAVFVVAIIGGIVSAGVRGLAFWRRFGSFRRRLDVAVVETTRLIDGIQPRVDKASASAVRLEEARTRLQESTAAASVLFAAFGEALALLRRVSAFVPR